MIALAPTAAAPVAVPASAATERPDAASVKIVSHNVVHLRAEPRSGTELVSQTLLGRIVRVLKIDGAWSYVESDDAYEGWAETRWLADQETSEQTVTTTVFAELRAEPGATAPLMARLPILNGVYVEGREANGYVAVRLPGTKTRGFLPVAALKPLPSISAACVGEAAVRWGQEFLGTPYLWGGSSSYGLDCSGFVQLCYRLSGITLRRDADIQRDDPRFMPVAENDLQPGDLVFFGKPDRITHVGMFLRKGEFIHSAGGAGVIVSSTDPNDRYWGSYVDARRLNPVRAQDPVTRATKRNR